MTSTNAFHDELPHPVSQESKTSYFDADSMLDHEESTSSAPSPASVPSGSGPSISKPLQSSTLVSQNSLGAHDPSIPSETSVLLSTNTAVGVIGQSRHTNDAIIAHLQPQVKQNERNSDLLPLSFGPQYAIVGAQAMENQAKQQSEVSDQFNEPVPASDDSYFSYHVAEQPATITSANNMLLESTSRPFDGRDLLSFGPNSSQKSTDAFQNGESFGFSFESGRNSPFAPDDSPLSPTQNWLPPVPSQDNKVGNVILVPRPGRIEGPVAYTAPPYQHHNHYNPYAALALSQGHTGPGGRRKVKLKLQEDVKHQDVTRRSFFFRKKSGRGFGRESIAIGQTEESVDRGTITVSWYDGTSSLELQEHVRRSVIRKLGLEAGTRLHDMRVLDETIDPPEEIVLSPSIPDGSHFLLRFSTKDELAIESRQSDRWSERAPESPGASPSPYPSSQDLVGLNATQLALIASRWNPLSNPNMNGNGGLPGSFPAGILRNGSAGLAQTKPSYEDTSELKTLPSSKVDKVESKVKAEDGDASSKLSLADTEDDALSMHPDDLIEERLRKITELLLHDRRRRYSRRRQEKRQVIFVLANYFVLFLSLIAISAEIQGRAPNWLAWVESELASVQQCATDQDALFKCVSNGDFAGLIASVVLWLSRSATTKRIFLFGFKSPKQLWTVVYEALVTGVCWGFSYLFIRRAMNPETRKNYFQKYWKDAVYGSLAGFNAAFMKHVLKNLIPQERFEEALQQKQLNIFSWFPGLLKK